MQQISTSQSILLALLRDMCLPSHDPECIKYRKSYCPDSKVSFHKASTIANHMYLSCLSIYLVGNVPNPAHLCTAGLCRSGADFHMKAQFFCWTWVTNHGFVHLRHSASCKTTSNHLTASCRSSGCFGFRV